jgi:hypothetical protein
MVVDVVVSRKTDIPSSKEEERQPKMDDLGGRNVDFCDII